MQAESPKSTETAGVAGTIELLDLAATCARLGGIHPATLYRGIKAKRYPAPLKIGPKTNRWNSAELDAVIEQLGAARTATAA